MKISDIDLTNNYITTTSRKTRKSVGSRPVSAQVMAELSKYVSGLTVEQEKLFSDNFSQNKWKKICEIAGLSGLRFHDLRKTFGRQHICTDAKTIYNKNQQPSETAPDC